MFDQRRHSERNEIGQGICKGQYLLPSYEDEGNLARCFIEHPHGAFSFFYGGWNRLVAVKDGGKDLVHCGRRPGADCKGDFA